MQRNGGRRRVAVVGAGVAGLTAAHILQCSTDVTLYEAAPRILISEDEDASGEGVLQGLWSMVEKSIALSQPQPPKLPPLSPLDAMVIENLAKRRSRKSK